MPLFKSQLEPDTLISPDFSSPVSPTFRCSSVPMMYWIVMSSLRASLFCQNQRRPCTPKTLITSTAQATGRKKVPCQSGPREGSCSFHSYAADTPGRTHFPTLSISPPSLEGRSPRQSPGGEEIRSAGPAADSAAGVLPDQRADPERQRRGKQVIV